MGKSNTEQLKIAEKYLGESCRKCCSMANNCCAYFVSKIFKEAGNASLFYGGAITTYCPNAIKWCKANLAEIPIYLAMPSDIIFFDWEPNGVPNHIGFVDHRLSDAQIYTLEGNTTSKGIVARRTRPLKYVQGVFRPHFKGTYDTSKALAVDGQFGYNSIAMLQKALGIKVDGILGKDTVKALQKRVAVTQDGAWGPNTSKAVQKMVGTTVDGAFGEKSVKALQTWINKQVGKTTTTATNSSVSKPQSVTQPSASTASGKLTVDGHGGPLTVKALQKFLGTTQDGVISGQTESLNKYYPALEAVEYGKGGSTAVKYLQKWLSLSQDGIWGQATSKALQKKLGVTQDGVFGVNSMKALQKYLNEHDKATYPTQTIVQKELEACKVQAEWMKNYTYDWSKWKPQTIAQSKYYGTCVTYVACVLMRIGILSSGQYIWHDSKGKVYGNNSKMTVTYPKGTLKSLKSTLKAGDIIIGGKASSVGAGGQSHIFIITGEWTSAGSAYVWDNNSAKRIKQGKSGKHTIGGGYNVIAVIRLK